MNNADDLKAMFDLGWLAGIAARQGLHGTTNKLTDKAQAMINDGERKENLPDDSEFLITYDAALKEWRGMLTIVLHEKKEEGRTTPVKHFFGKAGGAFELIRKLDEEYRKWAGEKENSLDEKPAE